MVYDPHAMASDISRAVQETGRRAGNEIAPRRKGHANGDGSLFVSMVDHSKTALTLSKVLSGNFNRCVVTIAVRDDDFPESILITYIESSKCAGRVINKLIQF